MTDNFDLRLQRLADTPIGSAPSVSELHRRGRQRAVRRAQIGIAGVVVLVLLVLLASLAFAGAAPSKVVTVTDVPRTSTTTAPSTTTTSTTPGGPGAGDQPIAGKGGGIAGFVDAEVWAQAQIDGPPKLAIGTGAIDIRGFEVRDAGGQLVGYYLTGDIGFLPLASAADPKHVDELVTANAPMSNDEARALAEKLQAEAEAKDRAEGNGN